VSEDGDILDELLVALLDGTTMGWAMTHAPDGDVDAALRRLWATTHDDITMIQVLEAARHPSVATIRGDAHPWGAHGGQCPRACARCAGLIRETVLVPPTFAALLAGRR